MKTCYYEILGVDKKATSSEIKKVPSSLNSRVIEWCPWNIILTKTPPNKQKRSSFNWPTPITCFQIPTKEPGTITIDKKYSSIKKKCQRKMLKCIHLVSIFGTTLPHPVLKATKMKKGPFTTFTGTYLKKLKLNKRNHLPWGMTLKKKWENFKVSEIQPQYWKEFLLFMMIGKISQHTKLLCGPKIGTQEKLQIDTWKERWKRKIKKKGKNRKKITSKRSRI